MAQFIGQGDPRTPSGDRHPGPAPADLRRDWPERRGTRRGRCAMRGCPRRSPARRTSRRCRVWPATPRGRADGRAARRPRSAPRGRSAHTRGGRSPNAETLLARRGPRSGLAGRRANLHGHSGLRAVRSSWLRQAEVAPWARAAVGSPCHEPAGGCCTHQPTTRDELAGAAGLCASAKLLQDHLRPPPRAARRGPPRCPPTRAPRLPAPSRGRGALSPPAPRRGTRGAGRCRRSAGRRGR